jgi:hypothetical protein
LHTYQTPPFLEGRGLHALQGKGLKGFFHGQPLLKN